MQLTVSEIDARVNATLELQQAINYLQTKDNVNGNPHVTLWPINIWTLQWDIKQRKII